MGFAVCPWHMTNRGNPVVALTSNVHWPGCTPLSPIFGAEDIAELCHHDKRAKPRWWWFPDEWVPHGLENQTSWWRQQKHRLLEKSQRTCKNCKRLTRQAIKIKRTRVQLGEHWQRRLATVMCAIEFSQKLWRCQLILMRRLFALWNKSHEDGRKNSSFEFFSRLMLFLMIADGIG